MLKVALTGGIATGKSYVLNRFRHLGVPCLDADELAHGVEAAGTEATAAIAARFGAEVLTADGSVDRAKLGPIVFADPAARRELEAIVHPAVYRAIAAGIRAFELTGTHRFAIVDVPLLFETGAEQRFDRVIVTACSADLQIARLKARGLSEDAARQRLAAQWPTEQKIAGADFVVHTDGTFDDTSRQVAGIASQLQT
ncbi:MAG TPA: dephospho-CoA kinase [Vicinamibacterales bacterium]|nr:dephospho-CoA kinase [Vicinamibacterales bacterium]